MAYLKTLPENCPPADANGSEQERTVFRLVKPVRQRCMIFVHNFTVDECYALGLSVYSEAKALDNARKLPRHKSSLACKVILTKGAGKILKTFSDPHHFRWWPLASYNIIRQCEIVNP